MKKILLKIASKNILCAKYVSYLKLIWNKVNNTNNYKEFLQLMENFSQHEMMNDSRYVHKIAKDAYFSNLYYKINFKEYFLYDFWKLCDKGRKQFIGEIERCEMIEKLNKNNIINILKDKYKCFIQFKQFYKRDIVKISKEEDKEIFKEFCKKHSYFIVKPIDLNQGRGIYIVDLKLEESINDVWNKIFGGGYGIYILEELVIQAPDLGKFHPQSVNTIRFATYKNNNVVIKLFAILRMGQGDSVVDNVSAGGISAVIDIETGIIITPGKDFSGKIFLKHPDTDIIILGQKIPRWNELCKIVTKAAESFPEYNDISFDFALTEKGWTMIEVNGDGGLKAYQMFGYGLRQKFEDVS